MSDSPRRSVRIEKSAPKKFTVTNVRGGQLTTGAGEDTDFTPGELLLAAIGACTGVDTDILTSRRGEATKFVIEVSANKASGPPLGNRLEDLVVRYDIEFTEGPDGDAAREILPQVVERSRQKLCTVGRTVEIGTPIADEFGPIED